MTTKEKAATPAGLMSISKTRVVNLKHELYDVYIGRGTVWGNPFHVGRDGTRREVIEKFREYAPKNRELMRRLPELKDQRLGCYCKPLPCHGDVLVELLHERLLWNELVTIFGKDDTGCRKRLRMLLKHLLRENYHTAIKLVQLWAASGQLAKDLARQAVTRIENLSK